MPGGYEASAQQPNESVKVEKSSMVAMLLEAGEEMPLPGAQGTGSGARRARAHNGHWTRGAGPMDDARGAVNCGAERRDEAGSGLGLPNPTSVNLRRNLGVTFTALFTFGDCTGVVPPKRGLVTLTPSAVNSVASVPTTRNTQHDADDG